MRLRLFRLLASDHDTVFVEVAVGRRKNLRLFFLRLLGFAVSTGFFFGHFGTPITVPLRRTPRRVDAGGSRGACFDRSDAASGAAGGRVYVARTCNFKVGVCAGDSKGRVLPLCQIKDLAAPDPPPREGARSFSEVHQKFVLGALSIHQRPFALQT